jgi:hypothetical protein
MVYLVLEPRAASETIRLANETGCSVWVGSDSITPEEHNCLVRAGAKVTRFSYPLANVTGEIVAGALETIEEHHPGEIVWVQHVWAESIA